MPWPSTWLFGRAPEASRAGHDFRIVTATATGPRLPLRVLADLKRKLPVRARQAILVGEMCLEGAIEEGEAVRCEPDERSPAIAWVWPAGEEACLDQPVKSLGDSPEETIVACISSVGEASRSSSRPISRTRRP